MKKNPRESKLQKDIIDLLFDRSDRLNVSDIAKELGRHRSSVSRSVALLVERGWLTSENGRYQVDSDMAILRSVEREQEATRRMMEATQEMATIKIPRDLVIPDIPLQDIARSMIPIVESGLFEKNAIAQYANLYRQAVQSIDFEMISAAAGMAKTVSRMMQSVDLEPIYKNISYIAKCQDMMTDSFRHDLYDCVSSYSSFLIEAKEIDLPERRIERVSESTSSALTAASYSIPESDDTSVEIPEKPLLVEEKDLDHFLKKIDPGLVTIRKGAWQTFNSGNPDKDRQACHSMRELLRLILDELAPGKGERKEKVKAILGSKSETQLIESLFNVVDEAYARLSAVSHKGNNQHYQNVSVEFTLATTQNVIAEIVLMHFNKN